MSYKTFMEQVISHIEFLRANGLDIEALEIDAGFIRCRAIDSKEQERGSGTYQTKKNSLESKHAQSILKLKHTNKNIFIE